jgi:tetratricopeptide (TPR) repeat protein
MVYMPFLPCELHRVRPALRLPRLLSGLLYGGVVLTVAMCGVPPGWGMVPTTPSLHRDLNHPTGTLLYAISAQLASRGELITAEGMLQPSVMLLPNDPMVKVTYAYVLEGLGKHTEAIKTYQDALQLDSSLYQAHYSLAMLLDKTGDTPAGIDHLQKAIALAPLNGMMHYDLGVLYAKVGNYTKAAHHSAEAADSMPQMAEAYNNYGYALGYLGQYQDALNALDRALSLKPDSPAALDSKGFVLYKMGRYKQAVTLFQQAIGLDPTIGDIYLHLGQTWEKLNNKTLALKAYQRYLELTPEQDDSRATVRAKLLNMHPSALSSQAVSADDTDPHQAADDEAPLP